MATATAPPVAPPKLGYRPSLDGLRAIAVTAVVLYHADVGWMPGGFLGVEVFFVVSGFLITALLIDERHHSGAISLRQFWGRRARRLLPALYLLLLVVSVASLLVYRDAAGRMGGDVLAALLYVSNWWQIYLNESYFAQAGRPPLLQHLWSLAIEEQFYVVFPAVFALGMAKVGRKKVAWILGGLSLASAAWMAIRFEEFTDPSAVYYSTFTRASGLLVGALLAVLWAPWRTRGRAAASAGRALDAAGVAGLLLIAWFFVRVNAFDPFIYRGGMLLLDVICVVVIAVLVHPASQLHKVLGWAPLRWIGVRSYSIYLWHWPIFMVTRPELDLPFTGWPVFVLRIGLTMGAAEVSYRYVEQPLRSGALGSWWRSFRESTGQRRAAYARQLTIVGGTSLALVALIAMGLQQAASSPDREKIALEAAAVPDLEEAMTTSTAPPTTTTTLPPTTVAGQAVAPATAPPVAPATTVGVTQTATNAVAVGDSVMLGASGPLKTAMPGLTVNAKVGRQFDTVLQVVQWFVSEGKAPGPIIIHAGTNGTFSDGDLDRLFEIAGDRQVLLVNAKVERPWQDLVNQRLADAAERHPNAVLVDWHGLSADHPEWFAPDGAHLRPAGARAYADLIRSNL
ncbi:acyltransferase family protein [Dermatobacter hominis]|uniref:acyltransferase family protein n=1 Tax=Dermatobacter hominis TaxID=2884263 RepID=UPI001D1249D4|nr:acyltransferase family protein [Dermatobacter hominis]UDY37688.1 acetyltransferase [Dermatobacter hominis]